MQDQLSNIYSILAGSSTGAMQQIGALAFLFLMGVSLASSLFIAYLYVHFFSSRATGSQVHRAFPLLGLSVTAIFICIQFSLPLSLGLLGALSIVRFRTPIKEPEEIGFIMLVIAVSIACATYQLAFIGILFVVAIAALLVQRFSRLLRRTIRDGVIVISMPAQEYATHAAVLDQTIEKRLVKAQLESVSKNDGAMVLSYNFTGLTQPALLSLQADLDQLAGGSSFNIFFNRPGVP